jgi:DNA modification methylase
LFEFIKDKYGLTTTDIDTKSELSVIESDNTTHDYYEYEQGQATIIAKDRLENNYSFWKSIGCYKRRKSLRNS